MTNLKDLFNNPLNTDIISMKNVKVGNMTVKEVSLETEEDVVNFNKLGAKASTPPEQTPAPSPQVEPANQNSYADRPMSHLIDDYLTENQDKWSEGSFHEYNALFKEVVSMMGDVPVRAVTRLKARGHKEAMLAIRRKGKPL